MSYSWRNRSGLWLDLIYYLPWSNCRVLWYFTEVMQTSHVFKRSNG